MDTNKYKMLLKAIETGNLTRAAEQTGYTQSAITHMINLLEEHLGVALLERSRSGVTVTSAGKQLIPFIQDVCNSEKRLEEEVNSILELKKGIIRIGTFYSMSTNLLPHVIKEFKVEYPRVEIEIYDGGYGAVENMLNSGSVDIAFQVQPVQSKFECIDIFNDKAVVVMPKGHPLARYDVVPLDKLENEPFVFMKEDINDIFGQLLKDHQVFPDIKYRIKDDNTVMSMVDAGLGISLLSELVLKNSKFKGEVRHVSPTSVRTVSVVYNKSTKSSPLSMKFIEYIVSSDILEDILDE